jgi:hypothetical protein
MIKGEFNWTVEELVQMFMNPNYSFTADACGKCHKTANVICGAGWFCECGHYNILPFHNHFIPHGKPDLGPSRKKIRFAIIISHLWPTWYGRYKPDWLRYFAPDIALSD